MGVQIHPDGVAPAQQPAPAAQTPSQQVIAKATNAPVTIVTDELGRKIGWRPLRALENMDFGELVGSNAYSPIWMIYATAAYSVVEIDGERVPKPTTRNQLRALVQRLGDEGIMALKDSIIPPEDDEAAKQEAEAAKAAETEQAKN